jgi:phage-related baseplate assembly protein
MIETINLAALPPPDVVEILDFEAIYQSLLADFKVLYPDYSAALESDPVVKLLELAAYREMLVRARINDAAKSNLLAFSAGSDLDHLSAFYGVTRMGEELDDRLRLRTQFQIAALAGNGTRERYRAIAMEASADVIDCAVLQPAAGSVDLALWIADLPEDIKLPSGTTYEQANADHCAAVLELVRAAFAADDARMLGVPLTVRQAIPREIDVQAVIYREASAPVDLTDKLAEYLPAAIREHAKLGRDVPLSWILARLHMAGVSRVELINPAFDVILNPDEYAVSGIIYLTDGGVAW